MSKKSNENKESVVRDIVAIVCASGMIPFALALAFKGEYECALLGLILARLTLMERKNERASKGDFNPIIYFGADCIGGVLNYLPIRRR